MKHETLDKAAPEVISRDRYPEKDYGHYGPSQISGCSLKVIFDEVTDHEITMNSWMFAGKAVHYYLQETGILTEALKEAGYHPAFIDYEQTSKYKVKDGVYIHGSCDVLCEDEADKVVYDIKYSSIPVQSGHGRLYKYLSQAHLYARLFGAQGYGLLMINSKTQEFASGIEVMEGVMSEDNWEIMQQKAINIHETIELFKDERGLSFPHNEMDHIPDGFWKRIVSRIDTSNTPSYEKECNYCPHSEFCPVEQGKLGGIKSLISPDQ